MRCLGSIFGSSIMAAVLFRPTPPVENVRILYAALFLSACGAVFAGRRLTVWPKRGGDHEIEPSTLSNGHVDRDLRLVPMSPQGRTSERTNGA